jgi:hypothetical protein
MNRGEWFALAVCCIVVFACGAAIGLLRAISRAAGC